MCYKESRKNGGKIIIKKVRLVGKAAIVFYGNSFLINFSYFDKK